MTTTEADPTIQTESATLMITHVPSGTEVTFEGIGLRVYTESYSSEWNAEQVFGKMDPILSYKSTNRQISLEFIVDGDNVKFAEAMPAILYPTYKSADDVLSLKDPPLVRIYFKGVIQATDELGQLCAVTGMSLDRGSSWNDPTTTDKSAILTPQQIVMKLDLIPLHEFILGWTTDDDGNYSFSNRDGDGYYMSNQRIANITDETNED